MKRRNSSFRCIKRAVSGANIRHLRQDKANKRKNFEIEMAGRSDAFHGKECRESTRKQSRRKRKKAPYKDAF